MVWKQWSHHLSNRTLVPCIPQPSPPQPPPPRLVWCRWCCPPKNWCHPAKEKQTHKHILLMWWCLVFFIFMFLIIVYSICFGFFKYFLLFYLLYWSIDLISFALQRTLINLVAFKCATEIKFTLTLRNRHMWKNNLTSIETNIQKCKIQKLFTFYFGTKKRWTHNAS